jgi:ABC-type sugar transport system ATPase subunit
VTAIVPEGPSGPSGTVLEVHGLVKDYPGQRALDHMDLEVVRGEVHALLGENGAGKSTLIKAIVGAISFDSGEILLEGLPIAPRDPLEGHRLGIAVVHQHGNLVPTLSVAENLRLGRPFPKHGPFYLDRRALRRWAAGVLDEAGLGISPETTVSDLSPHQAGIVAIAKALTADAKVIVLDEPTTALAHAEVDILFRWMRRLAERGVTFIYISHRLGEVFEIADRITVMRDGKRVGTWLRSELDHDRLVEKLAGGEKALRSTARGASSLRDTVLLSARGLTGPGFGDVDFDLHTGEVLGFAGLPGAGARGTISALFGNPGASAGVVTLDGRAIAPRSPVEAMHAGLALVPKDRHAQALIPGFRVRENLTIASTERFRLDRFTRWLKLRAERQESHRLVEYMNVKTSGIEAEISSLSGGNQQKVVIGRWLSRNAKVYLLDDPTAGVDVHSKAEIYEKIRELAQAGAGVIFTSTELEEMTRVCDRVLVFRDGRVGGELVGADITESNILRLCFGTANGTTHPEEGNH